MPSREEESTASKKESRGKPLCPKCGREAYPSKHHRGRWECAKNEKCDWYRRKITFPSPSYGAKGKPSWLDRLLGRK